MNKLSLKGYGVAAALILQMAVFSSRAGTVSVEGVLANSGEQGESLVRFGDSRIVPGKVEPGIGVISDREGLLWSNGADGEVIRYAVDGRQLASYRIPELKASGKEVRFGCRAALCGDALLIKVGKKLSILRLDAQPASEATPLPVEAERLSFGTHEGWAAAAVGKQVFWVNAKGETRAIGEAPGPVRELEVGPGGEVYLRTDEMMQHETFIKMSEPGQFHPVPGRRPQWLNGSWFGHAGYSTIRRFNDLLEPDPGVILGGQSGAFIGYVPSNYELSEGTGMAWLGGNIYAVGGVPGILHLIEWNPLMKNARIVRRIGPLKRCDALAIDGDGRVWVHGGVLQWNDAPDAPLQHGSPKAGAKGDQEPFTAAVLPGGALVAAVINPAAPPTIFAGPMTSFATRTAAGIVPGDGVAGALVRWNNQPALLMVNAQGKGAAAYVAARSGKPTGKGGEVTLQFSASVEKLTSLTSDGGERLWAGADGQLLEFTLEGNAWKETKRWKQWSEGADGALGEENYIAYGGGKLWVADTRNHRILLFDAGSGKLLGQAGTTGHPGSSLSMFDNPRALAANGNRAVVFDAGNQRLVKLQWQE